MKSRDRYISEIKILKTSSQSDFQILRALRAQGCTIMDSIIIIRFAYGIDLSEAKRIVHTSDVWKQERSAYEQFHKIAEDVLTAPSDEGAQP